MSKNPLEDFLMEKDASQMGFPWARQTAGEVVRRAGSAIGEGALKGLGYAVGGAGIAGAGIAATALHDVITKQRDFRNMLENNPDLVQRHEQDPKYFNLLFTSLRNMNPAFSKDPLVAGTYMRKMVAMPETAGGVAVEALQHRDKIPSPVTDIFRQGALKGFGGGSSR